MSQSLIIGSVTIAALDTTIHDLTDKNKSNGPSFRIVIGAFVVLIVLLAVSDSNEELADAFAILILLSTLFGPSGGALSDLIGKVTKSGYVPPASIGKPIVVVPTYSDPNTKYNLDPTKRG